MASNNSQNSFNALLKKFEMISEGYKSPSLLLPDDLHLSDGDKIILEQAGKYNVDAVYIRQFNDGRTPIPQIYIYMILSKTPGKIMK